MGTKYDYYRSRFYHNGKQYMSYGKTQKEADQKAAIKKQQLENGEIGISKNMTVSAWCKQWLKTYKKNAVIEKSFKNYSRHVDLIISSIGNVKLKDVTNTHLQDILMNRTGYSWSEVTHVRMTIKAIFKKARLSRLITYDPAEDLELPRCKQGKRRSITDVERTMILKAAETHHAGLWIKMMLYCGLRPGEIIALQWKDIDLKKKLVNIYKAKESGTEDIKDPKTEAGVREVPIPDVFIKELETVKASPFAPFVTQKTTSNRHTEKSFYCSWGSFVRQMDIENGAKLFNNKIIISTIAPDLEPYCLRHTYCTDLESAGVPINVAKYLMGHSSILVTSKIYTHTTSAVISDAAEKINIKNAAKVS